MKILVPIEDPIFAAVLLQFICRHRWPENTELRLIHVVEPFLLEHGSSAAFSRLISQSENFIMKKANELLSSTAELLRNGSNLFDVSTELRTGTVLPEILASARREKADLIIAGSHGRSGFNRFLLGSVSLALVGEAPCPVLLVKPPETTIKIWDGLSENALAERAVSEFLPELENNERHAQKVLVCVNDKEMANKLLNFLLKHKWAHAAKFKLLSVVQPLGWANLISTADLHLMRSEMLQSKKELLNVLAIKLNEHTGIDVEAAVMEGNPKAAILSEASEWKADVLVLGSGACYSNQKDKKKIGSVALAIMSSANCSVLFLHEHKNHEMHRYLAATSASLT